LSPLRADSGRSPANKVDADLLDEIVQLGPRVAGGISGAVKAAKGDCSMNVRDAFGLIVRTIGLLCIILALNELRMILLISMTPEGEIIGAYAQNEASAAFAVVTGVVLLIACEPIVRLIYWKSQTQ
jgi:hypothetical protein